MKPCHICTIGTLADNEEQQRPGKPPSTLLLHIYPHQNAPIIVLKAVLSFPVSGTHQDLRELSHNDATSSSRKRAQANDQEEDESGINEAIELPLSLASERGKVGNATIQSGEIALQWSCKTVMK